MQQASKNADRAVLACMCTVLRKKDWQLSRRRRSLDTCQKSCHRASLPPLSAVETRAGCLLACLASPGFGGEMWRLHIGGQI